MVQPADATATVGTTGFGVADLHAADVLGGAMQAVTSGLWSQRGGLDGGVDGATHLRHGQDFFPPLPVLHRSASGVVAPATGG